MKYEKPQMVVLELEAQNIVVTSEGGSTDTDEAVWQVVYCYQ